MINWPEETLINNGILEDQRLVIETYIEEVTSLIDNLSDGKIHLGNVKKIFPILDENIIQYCVSIIELKYCVDSGKICTEDLMLVLGTPALSLNSLSSSMGLAQNILIQNYGVKFSIADISRMGLAFNTLSFIERSTFIRNILQAIKIFSPDSKLKLQVVSVNSHYFKTIKVVLDSIVNKVKSFPFIKLRETFFDKLKLETTLENTIATFIFNFEKIIKEEN